MSGNLNKALLIGRVVSDPKMKMDTKGNASMTFSLATNETWRKPDGSKAERASYHYCRLKGKRAEALEKYILKGTPLYVEGLINYEEWGAGEGKEKKTVTVINIFDLQLLPNGGASSSASGGERRRPRGETPPDPDPANGAETFDDGIPF